MEMCVMNVVIAIDSFKGSMTSMQAGQSAAAGIRRVYKDADVLVRPLADGGEGTVDALVSGCGGRMTKVQVTGPAGKPVVCSYGILDESQTAIIEMSGAAGITLVSDEDKNPMTTTTYGVGEVIKDAIRSGCRHFIIGIGGSATNDGGVGMLQALGYGFLDQNAMPIHYGASGLKDLKTITTENVLPELTDCTFRIACDVTNPLCGEQGCSAVFGPQKGADSAMIRQMDEWLASYAALAKETFPNADAEHPGTGAAGGLGFAFLTFCNAELEPGVDIILEETQLRRYIADADIVITGEGRLDGQTVMGKAPIGVARIAKECSKPVLAFSGCVTKDAAACNEAGIDAFFPVLRTIVSLDEAMNTENAMNNMTDTVEQVFRLIRTFESISQ
jgi:glycerate 2-kinase